MAAPGRGWIPLGRGLVAACFAVVLLMLLSDGLEALAGVLNLVVGLPAAQQWVRLRTAAAQRAVSHKILRETSRC
jgi:hypothetical protein